MAKTKRVREQPVRTVPMPDGSQLDAPYDPRCGACRSPWVPEIDEGLASGLSLEAILSDLKGRNPACPNAEIIRAHISHLPAPQREMRLLLENPARTQVDVSEALNEIIQRGYQRLADGRMEPTGADWLRAMQLKAKIQQAEERHASAEAYQAAFMALFAILKRYLGLAEWAAFTAECYRSPEILAVSNKAKALTAPKAGKG